MLVAVVDDALRQRGADAVDAVELLDGGSREVARPRQRAADAPAGEPAPDGSARPPLRGTRICCPSASRAARLTAREIGPRAWAAGTRKRVRHARSVGHPEQPRPAHRAGHVHVDARGLVAAASDDILTGAGGGSSCPPSSRAPATTASTAAIAHTTIVERELSGTRRT